MEEVVKNTIGYISEALIPCILIIVLLMPFWYIALYLLHRNFFERSPQFLKLCFCFCLAFCWFITFALFTMWLPAYELKAPEPSDDSILPLLGSSTHVFYFLSTSFSVLALCLFIVRQHYLIRKNKGKSFFSLLGYLYSGTIMGLTGCLIVLHIYAHFRK